MRKVFTFTLVLVIALSLFAGGQSDTTEGPIVIRVGLSEAMDNPVGLFAQEWKEKVEERTGGRVEMQIFPSGQLGGPREMLESVGFGNQEVTICTPTDLSSFVPEMGVCNFAFLFQDKEVAYEFFDGEIGEELSLAAEKAGFKVLGYPEIGFRQVTNSVRPITCLEDFNGIKIRTRGAAAHLDTFRTLGANPVAVNFSELYSALQQGIVDAQENSTTNILQNSFYDVQKYLSITNVFYEAWAVTMNLDFFNALPDDIREIIMTACQEAVVSNRAIVSQMNDESLLKLSELMEVNEIAPEEMARIVEVARSVYPDYADEVGEDLFNKVMAVLEE